MAKRVGFMFAGQGAQRVGMGRDLAEQSAGARALFETADTVLGRGLSSLCFEGPIEALTESANCQPAIYTTSLACMSAVQEKLDVELVACGGLSLGEFGALTAAGVLEFGQGLKLVATRGALMGEACRASDGAMAAVLNADLDLVQQTCADNGIDVANLNCPGQIVISGEKAGVEKTVEALSEAGVSRIIMLQVDGAFHSRLMAPAAEKFADVLAETEFSTPRCAVAQNAVGELVSDPSAIRENLRRQVTDSVRWEECVRALMGTGIEALIEFGPGKVLSGFMKRIDRGFPTYNVANAEDVDTVVAALSA